MSMSGATGRMLWSWFKVFAVAALTVVTVEYLPALQDNPQWAWLAAGLLAVIPVVINYLDRADPRYGHLPAPEAPKDSPAAPQEPPEELDRAAAALLADRPQAAVVEVAVPVQDMSISEMESWLEWRKTAAHGSESVDDD